MLHNAIFIDKKKQNFERNEFVSPTYHAIDVLAIIIAPLQDPNLYKMPQFATFIMQTNGYHLGFYAKVMISGK